MKTVLLTGASGFVGRHCLRFLAEEYDEVHAVSSRELPLSSDKIVWHRVDLLESAPLSELMSQVRPTHLLHFAWIVTPGVYWSSPDNFRWVQASLELLRLFGENGGKRVVTAGSCAEYDWNYGLLPRNRDTTNAADNLWHLQIRAKLVAAIVVAAERNQRGVGTDFLSLWAARSEFAPGAFGDARTVER